ncbi:amino acid ABC transporter permease [Mycolicibacterium thermoresistibile]
MSTTSVLFDAPGPRARRRNRIATAVTVVVVAAVFGVVLHRLAAQGQLAADKWTPFLNANVWKTYLLPGLRGTLVAAGISIVLAMILGVLFGVGRLAPWRVVRWPCAMLVEFFRAVPVLIMMIFAWQFYSLFNVVPARHSVLAGVVTGLTLYNGAVIAEAIRTGVNNLPRGQAEAAYALGMRWRQTMWSIELPQAITSMLPVLVSQMVVVLKDTALGYQISYLEVVRQGRIVGTAFQNYIPTLIVVAVLMIALNFALSALAGWIERRMRRSRRGPAPARAHAVEQDGVPGAPVR